MLQNKSSVLAAATAAAAVVALVLWRKRSGDGDDASERARVAALREKRRIELRGAARAVRRAKATRRRRGGGGAARDAARDATNEALLAAYGGDGAAVEVAARAHRAAEAAGRARLAAYLAGYAGRCADAPEVEVDLGWWAAHDSRGARSLVRQIANASAHARRALVPMAITLSSYTGDARAALDAAGAGEWLVLRDERSTWERRADRGGRVVYLTPDADEALVGLEDGVTYSNPRPRPSFFF